MCLKNLPLLKQTCSIVWVYNTCPCHFIFISSATVISKHLVILTKKINLTPTRASSFYSATFSIKLSFLIWCIYYLMFLIALINVFILLQVSRFAIQLFEIKSEDSNHLIIQQQYMNFHLVLQGHPDQTVYFRCNVLNSQNR